MTETSSQQTLRTVFDAMQTFVCIVDTDGTVNFINQTPLKIGRLNSDDILGKKLWDCFWFNYDIQVQTLIRNAIHRAARGEAIAEEVLGRTVASTMWVDLHIEPLIENGKTTALVVEAHDISEQKQLRENALLSQQRLQDLFDGLQTMIAILDIEGRITLINNTPLLISGLKQEDIIGRQFWTCPWYTDDLKTQAILKQALHDGLRGITSQREIQVNTNEGRIWVEFNIHPVWDGNGKVIQLVAEARDFSEQWRLREEANEAQQRLQGLFDDMKTMVAILDVEGHVTLVNNTPLLTSGLEAKDILEQPLWDCPWFTDDLRSQDIIRQHIANGLAGETSTGDIQIATPEGRIWVEFCLHPVLDGAGKVIQLVAEGSDPSTRRQVEEEREAVLLELQEREQNLAITLDSIGDAVITTDANGLITRMNPIAEQLTGWPFAEAQQQALASVFSIFNASTGEALASPIDKLMATGNIVHLSNHTTLHARGGSRYQIADSAAPIRDSEGEILGGILVFSDISEQYRLREQARSIQARLEKLFDNMQTMVGILNPDGILSFVNNTPLLATGFTREQVLNKKLWEAPWYDNQPESSAIIESDIARAAAGKSTLSDIKIDTLEGELWLAFGTHPIFDDAGHVVEVVAEARDISASKSTEMELRNTERRLLRYRDQAPLATIEWDTQHRVVGWNAAAEKLFGYTLEEVKRQTFSSLLPPDLHIDLDRIWRDLVVQSGGDTLTSKILTQAGETIYTRWHNAPFFDDDGQLIGAASVILDLTNERAAQLALKRSEKTLRSTLDSMVEGIVVTDQSGIIHSANQAVEKMTGYSTVELVGQPVTLLILGQSEAMFQANMQRYLDTGNLQHIGMGLELELACKNGDTFPTVLAVAELSQKDDQQQRFISSFRDLSDIKQQEEELRRSQKMDALGKLTGGIAHDFNNMLGIVTGYADLLEGALAGEKKLAQYAHEIHRAGERGANLTRKLLSFSQQTTLKAHSVDLNKLILSQQHMLATSLTPRITLVYDLEDRIWPIRVDSDDLEDAIINICINAMHAIDANGQVTLETKNIRLRPVNARLRNLPSGDYVLLSISDNGTGMDDATKERIFDPFYTTKGEEGTGLGLSQVYGFVERSHGSIDVTSVLGRGTRLQLCFPREQCDEDVAATSTATSAARLAGNETILVVDDENQLLELCTEILGQQGYRVLSASNCAEALQLLDSNRVDVLFSDVVMPDMDGYELALIVAKKYPAIKIQMTSGFTDDRQSAMVDDSLHQNLLVKPYRSQALLNKIRKLLDR
ncbi:hypothetical protein A9Q90_02715 [Gammaproteobacteria bacterium 54_18_T64]|nr:hypothetical protein A9Q90_02715 [Gammaproteobacteria bacterium 54_18_T64]